MDRDRKIELDDRRHDLDDTEEISTTDGTPRDEIAPNPPRTQTGPIAAPKFGSAGGGGAELEPGPERD
jgi:hypothetical protein